MSLEDFLELPFMDEVASPILFGLFMLLFVLEFFFILRKRYQKRVGRWITNLSIAAFGLPAARLLLLPLTIGFAYLCGEWNWGLLNWISLPDGLCLLLGMLILDYAIYLWHRINHMFPFLWRFHYVHHADQEMDITTGIRFHVGEMLLSIPFRLVVISVSGVSPSMLLIYELIFEAATLFHHSNIRLPIWLENGLVRLIVTPRMHGIHHSIVLDETNSNYSTVLNIWDRLHGTALLNVKQDAITIGVPGHRDKKENTFFKLLALPFIRQKEWRLPDGSEPLRSGEDRSDQLV